MLAPTNGFPAHEADVPEHPPQRYGPIRLGLQPSSEPVKEHGNPDPVDHVTDRDAINARSSTIRRDRHPRPPQHVPTGHLVIQGMDPAAAFLLGSPIQPMLKSMHRVKTAKHCSLGFMRRGLQAAQREWALICTTNNITKLFTHAKGRTLAATTIATT